MNRIYEDIAAERARQVAKWGSERQAPDYYHFGLHDVLMVNADMARRNCQRKFEEGEGSYSDILVEEVAEAVDEAAAGNLPALREELIQVAAVAVAWIELLDKERA